MTSECSDNIVASNKTWHDRKNENRGTAIQCGVSDNAFNCVLYLTS
jgi:hypothetical protein